MPRLIVLEVLTDGVGYMGIENVDVHRLSEMSPFFIELTLFSKDKIKQHEDQIWRPHPAGALTIVLPKHFPDSL